MKKASKFLAFLLSIMMVLSVTPVIGFAEGEVEDVTVKYPLVQTVHLSKDVTSTERMFFNTKNLGVTGDRVAEFSDSSTGNYGDLGVMMTFKIGDTDDLKSAMVKVHAAVHSTSNTGYLGTEINGNTTLTLRMYSTADMRIQEGTSPAGDALVAYDATIRATYAAFYNNMIATNVSGSTLKTRSNEILQYGNWNNSETYPVSINLNEITLAANSDLTLVMGMPGDTYYSAENAEKLPYIEMVYDGAAVLAKLNAVESKSELLAFLNVWGEAIGIDMTSYNALSAPLQDKALGQVAGKDFASFDAFKTVFNGAVDEAASIVDTVTVKVPIVQTVNVSKPATDATTTNITFNLVQRYGIDGDKVNFFNDSWLYYDYAGPLMTFKIGETENLNSATLKLKAARNSSTETAGSEVANTYLKIVKYSTDDIAIGTTGTVVETIADSSSYYTFYGAMNKISGGLAAAELHKYGNMSNSETYWNSFNLLNTEKIALKENSYLTVVINPTNKDDYFSAQKLENLPYIEMVYDAIPMVYSVNQAADKSEMQTALDSVAGFEFDTLSDSQKTSVADEILSNRPAAGYADYAALKKAYINALGGEHNALINRVKFDGSSISEVCYLADSVNSGAKLVFAAFSGNELMKAVYADAYAVAAGESPARKIAISSMSGLEGVDKIKVFLWNGLSEIVPLAECFEPASLTSGSNYYYSDGSTASVNN